MTVKAQQTNKDSNRKIKSHRKSRQGCGNCKLRKVKCDESKPSCRNCESYGVVCSYDPKEPALELLAGGGTFQIKTLNIVRNDTRKNKPCSRDQLISRPWGQPRSGFLDANEVYQLGLQDLELLCKFQQRTIFGISIGKVRQVYSQETTNATSQPFFLHTVLLTTLLHERFLSQRPNDKLSSTEAFHWYRSVSLFRNKLSRPACPSEHDAIWATGALLGTMTFHHIDAKTPEEAWPLKAPSSSDLNWLRMCNGKREILIPTDSVHSGDSSGESSSGYITSLPATPEPRELGALPHGILELCELDARSTETSSPYYSAASALADTLGTDDIVLTILNFWKFVGKMRPEFKRLLEQKDPYALLILVYWFAKLALGQHWWPWRRATLEGQAICRYLNIFHGEDDRVEQLLVFPSMACA